LCEAYKTVSRIEIDNIEKAVNSNPRVVRVAHDTTGVQIRPQLVLCDKKQDFD